MGNNKITNNKTTVAGTASQLPVASTSDNLTPEERTEHDRRMHANLTKATLAQQRDVEHNIQKRLEDAETQKVLRERQREANQTAAAFAAVLARATQEGVVEATFQDKDGTWWAQTSESTWAEAKGTYLCTHCHKHLNQHTLEEHLEHPTHQGKLGKLSSSTPASFVTSSANSSSLSSTHTVDNTGLPRLEEWQEPSGRGPRCIPCGKVIDDYHLKLPAHQSKLAYWLEQLALEKQGWPEPPEPYLAYVPSKDARWRTKMCLVCTHDGKIGTEVWDSETHTGTPCAPHGTKLHMERLQEYNEFAKDIQLNKLKYHPALERSQLPTPARSSTATAWLGPLEEPEEIAV